MKRMTIKSRNYICDIGIENQIETFVDKFKNGEDVYIQFPANHKTKPKSIGRIVKISGPKSTKDIDWKNDLIQRCSDYSITLAWDGLKKKSTIKLNVGGYSFLDNYTGGTVFNEFNKNEYIKEYANLKDRLGKTIHKGDVVVFSDTNSTGIQLGTIIDIEYIIDWPYHNNYNTAPSVSTIVIIEVLPLDEKDTKCHTVKISKPYKRLIVLSDADSYLMEKAFEAKITSD